MNSVFCAFDQSYGLDWIRFRKMDPRPSLRYILRPLPLLPLSGHQLPAIFWTTRTLIVSVPSFCNRDQLGCHEAVVLLSIPYSGFFLRSFAFELLFFTGFRTHVIKKQTAIRESASAL